MQSIEPPRVIQALPASSMKDKELPAKQDIIARDTTTSSPRTPASSRCTRSQAAPGWTKHETLVLLSAIAAVDDVWFNAFSSYQKWKMIADNCIASGVGRSSNQCKTRWELLLADYRKIKDWESKNGVGSYWCLEVDRRKQFKILALFDQEVFDLMDAFIKANETISGTGDSDAEDLIGVADEEMVHVHADLGKSAKAEMVLVHADLGESAKEEMVHAHDNLVSEEEAQIETWKGMDMVRELTVNLEENVEHIHAILRGEIEDTASQGHSAVDFTKPNAIETEFTRRQAKELIKSFGGFISCLNQLTELIKDAEREGIKPISMEL